MFYTTNSSQMLVTKSVFKLIFVLSKYQTSTFPLKERYRIGKKQKSWRSQIYIKHTRSNDDDSWTHPLKYFRLKCHIWWEINNLTSRLELIAQWVFYSFLFWHWCNAKFAIGFSLSSRDPDGGSILNFYRFVLKNVSRLLTISMTYIFKYLHVL